MNEARKSRRERDGSPGGTQTTRLERLAPIWHRRLGFRSLANARRFSSLVFHENHRNLQKWRESR